MSNSKLAQLVARIERLEEERAALGEDIRQVYAEAKGAGYDAKALRAIIRERAQDSAKKAELDVLIELYKRELGMLADTPLGQAAMPRAA
jgi:uncharacterized protein (UPF0335 family)